MQITEKLCPTPVKIKYKTEEEALAAAAEATESLGELFKVHHTCPCQRFHIYNRTKKARKENRRESRRAKARRIREGRPSPFQLEQERLACLKRKKRRFQELKRKRRAREPISSWENEGGALAPQCHAPGRRGID